MAEDFLHQQRTRLRNIELGFDEDIFNLAVNDLQDRVISMGGRQLLDYGLPQPEAVDSNRLAQDYQQEIQAHVEQHAALLTSD